MFKTAILFFAWAIVAFAQSGFSVGSIDKSINPCDDFYLYACGNWIKENPIPSDQSRWGRFNELAERNSRLLKDILETTNAKKTRSAIEQQIGDYYSACTDEKAATDKGAAPLKPVLDRISALKEVSALAELIGFLHRTGAGALFTFYSSPDNKNAQRVIAQADQGGLTLPDRDYYVRTDEKSVELRQQYLAHVQRMFELLGYEKDKAAAAAKVVLDTETSLAKVSLDRVSRRDPNNTYHLLPRKALLASSPSFDWNAYLKQIEAPAFEDLNIVNPDFFKGFDAFLKTVSVEDLGEALGQKYVEVAFANESKQRMIELVRNVQKALGADIREIDWMTPATKGRALEKLAAIADKIGYPEKYRVYSFEVHPADRLGNSQRANGFAYKRVLDKIGKAPDPKEWSMTPPTVNAYYSPKLNNINFPAGVLQPPFFDPKLDDPVNYGGIGLVIGHELTHGFDDQGRRFDALGNMSDWWTQADAREFDKRAACIDNQYGSYTSIGDLKLNGKLTLGENVADNGGARVAYMALMEALKTKPQGKLEGYTPEQRFFLGFAQVWCQNITGEAARFRAQTDPHSPGNYRVNGTVSNMPEFWQAFSCKPGQPMVRGENACRVW